MRFIFNILTKTLQSILIYERTDFQKTVDLLGIIDGLLRPQLITYIYI